MNYEKLKKIGASFLWFLGMVIFVAQVYRIIAFYIFDIEFEVEWKRDGIFAVFAFILMFIQNGLKSAIMGLIKSKFIKNGKNNAE